MIASSLLELVIIALDFDLIYIENFRKNVSRASCFVLTCVCDLLPCTTEEFHLSMDEVVDNESHCSQILRLTFLSYLVSIGHTGNEKLLVCKVYLQLFCGPVNAMFVDTACLRGYLNIFYHTYIYNTICKKYFLNIFLRWLTRLLKILFYEDYDYASSQRIAALFELRNVRHGFWEIYFSSIICKRERHIEKKSNLILLANGNDETRSRSWHTQRATTTIDDRWRFTETRFYRP